MISIHVLICVFKRGYNEGLCTITQLIGADELAAGATGNTIWADGAWKAGLAGQGDSGAAQGRDNSNENREGLHCDGFRVDSVLGKVRSAVWWLFPRSTSRGWSIFLYSSSSFKFPLLRYLTPVKV